MDGHQAGFCNVRWYLPARVSSSQVLRNHVLDRTRIQEQTHLMTLLRVGLHNGKTHCLFL